MGSQVPDIVDDARAFRQDLNMQRSWMSRALATVGGSRLRAIAVTIALCSISSLGLWHSLQYRAVEFDDAYITFRHAHNLSQGYGPVFNPGESVEGTSSLPFAVLLSPFIAAGVNPLTAARVISVPCFIGLIVVVYLTVTATLERTLAWAPGLAACAIAAASTPLAYHAQTGMETVPFALLLMLGVYFHVRYVRFGRGERIWPITMGLVAIARPEGGAFFLALLALLVGQRASHGAPWRLAARELGRHAFWFAAVFAPFLVFRIAYYGAWLPNPVFAKAGAMARFAGVGPVVAARMFWQGTGVQAAVLMVEHLGMGAVLLPAGLLLRRVRYASLTMLAVGLVAVLVNESVEGDWMPHARLLTPAVAPAAVAVGLGLRAALFHAGQRVRGTHMPSLLACAVVSWSSASAMWYQRDYRFPHTEIVEYLKRVGGALALARREDDVLATDMAGTLPYYSGLHTIDMFGLCDAHIARHGKRWARMGKLDLDYVIRARPTYYLFNFPSWARDLYRQPSFADQTDDYFAVLTPAYLRYRGADRKLLLVRKDRPQLDQLRLLLNARFIDARAELRRLGLWR
jgi:arabinofuranosyltransferase